MKILFLSQVLPYPMDAGPKVRSFYNISYLSQKHSITLLAFVRGSDTQDAVNYLKTICDKVETVQMPRSRIRDILAAGKSLLTSEPFLLARDYVLGMEKTIFKLVTQTQFDVIHSDQLWMAPYAIKAREDAIKFGYKPGLVLDQHNAVFLIPKRLANSTKNPLLRMWLHRESRLMSTSEIKICNQFDRVVWVTKQDLAAVKSICTNHNSNLENRRFEKDSIIPICFEPIISNSSESIINSQDILFLGGMHWPPNAEGVIWFSKEILPLINKVIPHIRFMAVGKQPPGEIKSRANIVAPGFEANVDNYWSSARVFVVPLRAGGGMRVKILDAWAKGVPVVATTIGAEGIDYSEGKDILIADSPEDFARAVTSVLFDVDLALHLSQGGKQTLVEKYDWRKIYHAWDNVYNFK